MKVHEAAKKLGMKSKELAEQLGYDHHMDVLTDAQVIDLGLVEVEVKAKPAKKTQAQIKTIQAKADMLRACLGDKSNQYLEHVSAYRDVITSEYAKAKHLIDIYL